MPANLIPLVTNSGRIFTSNKVKPESDGLVGIIDITERNKSHLPSEAIFNATGDSLLVADSRNQVTLLQIGHNRFNVVVGNLRETPHTVLFTGKPSTQDQVLIVLKEQKRLQLHALNGKLLESIQSNLHHQLEIKSAQVCPRVGLLLTLSNDACVLWSTNSSATIKKERQLFAQQGCHFSDAKFSPDGRQVGTLFRDGNMVMWELDGISGLPNRQQDGQMFKFQFPSAQIKLFDIGHNMVVGAGPQYPYLIVKHTQNANGVSIEQGNGPCTMYKLPSEARGIEQVAFLTDKLLLGYLSEGIFYLVDLGQQNQNKLQIALEIRLPACQIKRFSVDHPMNALALTATNGNVFLYNLPAAILNEQTLAKKRQQMGIEKELLYQYLVAVEESALEDNQLQNKNNTHNMIAVDALSEASSSHTMNPGQEAAYHNPFLTVGQNEGAGVILSQREGGRPTQSPLQGTMEPTQLFNATGDIAGQTFARQLFSISEQGPNYPSQIATVRKHNDQLQQANTIPQQSMQKHNQSEQNYQFHPMQLGAVQSQDGTSSHYQSKNIVNIQQQVQAQPQYQLDYNQKPLSISSQMQNLRIEGVQPQTQNVNMHNISQSTVAGPYLHQQQQQPSQRTAAPSRPMSHTGSAFSAYQNPIVQQLTVPVDRTQTIVPQSNRTMTQDYLIQGIPTALLDQTKGVSIDPSADGGSNQKFDHSIDLNYNPEYKETESVSGTMQAASTQFNLPKLRRLLKQYGQFPDKYRTLTWKYLLKLPLNKEAFQGLLSRGVHPAFKDLHKRFPVASYRLYNKLVRIMSALGHWSPVFLDVSYMPQIVFPFLKVIPNDDLFVFELIVSIIVQWMQVWFESYPAEPHSICLAVEQILSTEEPRLAQQLRDMGLQPQNYAMPLLTSFFTEALSKEDWLRLMDHLFLRSSEPELLLYYLGAYLICSKAQLMQISCVEDLAVFLNTPTAIPFKKVMTLAENLHAKLKTQIFPGSFAQNLPICSPDAAGESSGYQSFTRFPDHFVSFQNRLREKIVNQEEEIQRKNEILVDLKGKANEILEQEERVRLQQEAMVRAEADRKGKVRTEMETLLQDRIRMDELQRKARLEHVQAIEKSIKTSLTQQEKLKEEEHQQVQEEVNMITRQQKYEFESRMQDEMIANLEFKANQKLLEQLQKQQQDEHSRQTREKLDGLHQEVLHRQRESMQRWEEQRTETRRQNQMLTHQLKVQSEQLVSQREQQFIEEQFNAVKLAQEEMDMKIKSEQSARDKERIRAEELYREREETNRQLQIDKDRQKHEQEEQLRRIRDEYAELDRLKQEEVEDKERLEKLAEQRKLEVAKAREMREKEIFEDQRLAEERQRIEQEKGQLLKNREQIDQQAQSEIERRDFMKMIRTTAENARGIAIDGQRQLDQDRETRQSQQQLLLKSNEHQPPTWVMAHPKYNQQRMDEAPSEIQPQQQSMMVQEIIEERERRVREQNESLAEQLSLQYSHRLHLEKENQGKVGNGAPNMINESHNLSTVSQERGANYHQQYQNPNQFDHQYSQQQQQQHQQQQLVLQQQNAQQAASIVSLRQKDPREIAAYMTPSSTTDSHFSDESSDVESYHQSQLKKPFNMAATHVPLNGGSQPSAVEYVAAQPYHQNQMSAHLIQTHMMPMNHQQLNSMMPQSKSSIGEDISSSFVSSQTESEIGFQHVIEGHQGSSTTKMTYDNVVNQDYQQYSQQQLQRPQPIMTYGDISESSAVDDTSIMTSQQLGQSQQYIQSSQKAPQNVLQPQVNLNGGNEIHNYGSQPMVQEGVGAGASASAYGYSSNLVRQHQALTASLSESQSSAVTSSLHASNIE